MNKAIVQLLVLVAVFFLTWFGLSRIDFMTHLHLRGISGKMEKKIGDNIIKTLKSSNREIEDDSVAHIMDEIKDRLCTANAIDPADIHIHIIRSDEVNAFALPGHHIIVYTGLIKQCDSVPELCGVIGHEMGHIELNHVMKRLVSEMGIAIVASVATHGNSEIAGSIIKLLSSSAFERSQERAADEAAVRYLQQADISPKAFAGFMLKMDKTQSGMPKQMEWISTHPDSKKRAEDIESMMDKTPIKYKPVLHEGEWETLKDAAN